MYIYILEIFVIGERCEKKYAILSQQFKERLETDHDMDCTAHPTASSQYNKHTPGHSP